MLEYGSATPLIWIAIDRFSTHPNGRRALLLAGAIYLPGSAGSPPGWTRLRLPLAGLLLARARRPGSGASPAPAPVPA